MPETTTTPATTTLPPTTTTTLPPTTTTSTAASGQVVARNDAGMTIVAIEEVEQGDGWELALDRPRLAGHPDPAVQERINAQIDAQYDGVADAFRQDVAALEEGERYEVGISHEVTLLDDHVLSLRYYLFWSSSTAAHPTDDIETLLVNLTTGEPYTLPDLLSADSAPEALLALIDRHLLEDVFFEDEELFASVVAGRDEAQFGQWSLTPDSFDVSFGRYEAGPGVLGSFTLSIPYEELGALVNPAGPIARLMGSG